MTFSVENHLVMQFHRATGLPIVLAKSILATWKVEDQRRYVAAAERSNGGIIIDPLEEDPVAGPIIESVKKQATAAVLAEHQLTFAALEIRFPHLADLFKLGRGNCYTIWRLTKQRLWDEHGIDWHSPDELMPWVQFD